MNAVAAEIRVKVADFAVAAEGSIVTIGLGSCVAIALYDPQAQVAGLAHILLPSQTMSRDRANPAKFPETAIPLMLDGMRGLGARDERVAAKIVGGASMFANLASSNAINIGERNVKAVRDVLASMRIRIVAEDTGSDYGRSVYLFACDGRVEVRSIKRGTRVL